MAINKGLTLFLQVLVLKIIQCVISQEHLSAENINEILDKLILQTQQINETVPIADVQDLTPIVETQPNNDSSIYYFKTYMTPHINFKTSNENLHTFQHSNITSQSIEVFNEDHVPTSEDQPIPGTSKIFRKSFMEVTNKKEFIPRVLHGGQDRIYSEFKTRSGAIDKNEYSLEDLIKKEMVAELSTTNDNKHISLTQHGHQNQQLDILHKYPEIVIDHITYDNNENDENKTVKIKSTDPQPLQNVVKGETNNKAPTVQPRKIRYNIPEEDIESEDRETQEYFGPQKYLTPEMKDLIDTIIQKKVMHDALLKQTTESEFRKQSMLLEKILQRLPAKRQMTNNVKSSYSLHHERIAPPDSLSHLRGPHETLHRNGGNHLTKSYLKVPIVPSPWDIHHNLLRKLVRIYRPDVFKHTRLVAGLIDRIVPNIDYRPVYYDMYKK